MVYRGIPSAGCENCRKSRKKCTLEVPACARCKKLNKVCSGYRDTTGLQIRDETFWVTNKGDRRRTRTTFPLLVPEQPPQPQQEPSSASDNECTVDASSESSWPTVFTTEQCLWNSPSTVSSVPSRESIFGFLENHLSWSSPEDPEEEPNFSKTNGDLQVSRFCIANPVSRIVSFPIPQALGPKPEDIASSYFLQSFTGKGHWGHISKRADTPCLDPCLMLSIKACGMAALENTHRVPMSRQGSRDMYVRALSSLNRCLRDSDKCKTDESLIAVNLLSFYENLVCDDKRSIESWKAHIKGATQLLKLRGKAQFKTMVGRGLFRETRAQILIFCLWDDLQADDFLTEWNSELLAEDPAIDFLHPADTLTDIGFDLATLSGKIERRAISDPFAICAINEIDTRITRWSMETTMSDERWRFTDVQVSESPHVWNGILHSYAGLPVPTVWNTYRCVRIMVTRIQELLSQRSNQTFEARQVQYNHFRAVRRQLTDEICASVPCQLGHAHPAYSSPCVFTTALSSIWPLFFAGTCLLERIGSATTSSPPDPSLLNSQNSSAAVAQLAWVLGRLSYISKEVGLHWADGIAAMLKQNYFLHSRRLKTEDADCDGAPQLPRTAQDLLDRFAVEASLRHGLVAN